MCFHTEAKKIMHEVIISKPVSAKKNIENLISSLAEDFSATVQNKSDEIIEDLIGLRKLKLQSTDLDVSVMIGAAKKSFSMSYYRIAYEILLFIENEKSEDYICLMANILSMSGQFLKAATMLLELIKHNEKSSQAIETYGKLLIDNLPINESLRVIYLCLIINSTVIAMIPIILPLRTLTLS